MGKHIVNKMRSVTHLQLVAAFNEWRRMMPNEPYYSSDEGEDYGERCAECIQKIVTALTEAKSTERKRQIEESAIKKNSLQIEMYEVVRKMREQGATLAVIGRHIGRHPSTVRAILSRLARQLRKNSC